MLSRGWLVFALVLMALCILLLGRTSWKLLREPPRATRPSVRDRLTVAGLGFSLVSLSALFTLHLSWLSAGVSQYFGVAPIRILSFLVLWPSLAGLLFCCAGSGNIRLLGIGTSLATGLWLLVLSIGAAISTGAPLVRHPTRFLIPEAYVGWLKVRYGEKDAAPMHMENGTYICKIPDSGVLNTSSPLEEGWARDEYFYYSKDGSMLPLKSTGWGLGGMIWGESLQWEQAPTGSKPTRVAQLFYVGTEQQFRAGVSAKENRPFHESKAVKVAP